MESPHSILGLQYQRRKHWRLLGFRPLVSVGRLGEHRLAREQRELLVPSAHMGSVPWPRGCAKPKDLEQPPAWSKQTEHKTTETQRER